eukprot:scaffold100434_cov31-Tisochrysis_lutea.AAC.4
MSIRGWDTKLTTAVLSLERDDGRPIIVGRSPLLRSHFRSVAIASLPLPLRLRRQGGKAGEIIWKSSLLLVKNILTPDSPTYRRVFPNPIHPTSNHISVRCLSCTGLL